MPHSLRAKIKSLRYKGILEDKDYKRLCKALDNEGVLEKIRAEYKAEGEGVRKIRLVITLNNNTYDEIMNEDKLLSVQAKNDISLAILKAKPLIEYEREIGDMVNAENVFIIEKILAILNS